MHDGFSPEARNVMGCWAAKPEDRNLRNVSLSMNSMGAAHTNLLALCFVLQALESRLCLLQGRRRYCQKTLLCSVLGLCSFLEVTNPLSSIIGARTLSRGTTRRSKVRRTQAGRRVLILERCALPLCYGALPQWLWIICRNAQLLMAG